MTEPRPFNTELKEMADAFVVRVTGELDLSTCPQFRLCLDEAVAQETAQIVVDLTAVTFVDSAAMGALIICGRELAERGAVLEICCRTNTVARALQVTGLDRTFTVRVVD